jgi:hypothetical protein
MSAVLHHALWDSWIHERDIMIPLELEPEVHHDEVAPSLRYVAAMGPALATSRDGGARGVLGIVVTDPDLSLLVEVDGQVTVRDAAGSADLVLTGDCVEAVEALSIRRPMPWTIPPELAWMVAGVSEAFDTEI